MKDTTKLLIQGLKANRKKFRSAAWNLSRVEIANRLRNHGAARSAMLNLGADNRTLLDNVR